MLVLPPILQTRAEQASKKKKRKRRRRKKKKKNARFFGSFLFPCSRFFFPLCKNPLLLLLGNQNHSRYTETQQGGPCCSLFASLSRQHSAREEKKNAIFLAHSSLARDRKRAQREREPGSLFLLSLFSLFFLFGECRCVFRFVFGSELRKKKKTERKKQRNAVLFSLSPKIIIIISLSLVIVFSSSFSTPQPRVVMRSSPVRRRRRRRRG